MREIKRAAVGYGYGRQSGDNRREGRVHSVEPGKVSVPNGLSRLRRWVWVMLEARFPGRLAWRKGAKIDGSTEEVSG